MGNSDTAKCRQLCCHTCCGSSACTPYSHPINHADAGCDSLQSWRSGCRPMPATALKWKVPHVCSSPPVAGPGPQCGYSHESLACWRVQRLGLCPQHTYCTVLYCAVTTRPPPKQNRNLSVQPDLERFRRVEGRLQQVDGVKFPCSRSNMVTTATECNHGSRMTGRRCMCKHAPCVLHNTHKTSQKSMPLGPSLDW